MLDAIRIAHNVYGKRRKEIAQEVGVAPNTIFKWFNGYAKIPEHRRASLDRAMKARVDWMKYEGDFAANKNGPPRPKARRVEYEAKDVSPVGTPAPVDDMVSDKPKRGIFDFLDDWGGE